MTDFLLVSGMGLGRWAWSDVWGQLTSPVENPPNLSRKLRVGKVLPINIDGLMGEHVDPSISHDEAISNIEKLINDQKLSNLVMVGHDIAAPIVLNVASRMKNPPRAVILLAGVIPSHGASFRGSLSFAFRSQHFLTSVFSLGRRFQLPKYMIRNLWCNSMEFEEVVKVMGFFRSFPEALLRKPNLSPQPSYPITYMVLNKDRLILPNIQKRMALNLRQVKIEEINSCHAVMVEKAVLLSNKLLDYCE
jgi:pimeloyl-ACP methyl ester carboxylesterase